MLDIIYSEFTHYRETRENKKEQLNIAKGMMKRALLKFYLDWTSYRNSFKYSYSGATDTLMDYSKLFIDVSVEVYDVLPTRLTNEVTGIATRIRESVNETALICQDYSFEDILCKSDVCARDAYQVYMTFDEYFEEVSYNYK